MCYFFKDLVVIVEMMKECWKESPNGRLSSLNIKKKLKKISESLANF